MPSALKADLLDLKNILATLIGAGSAIAALAAPLGVPAKAIAAALAVASLLVLLIGDILAPNALEPSQLEQEAPAVMASVEDAAKAAGLAPKG